VKKGGTNKAPAPPRAWLTCFGADLTKTKGGGRKQALCLLRRPQYRKGLYATGRKENQTRKGTPVSIPKKKLPPDAGGNGAKTEGETKTGAKVSKEKSRKPMLLLQVRGRQPRGD